ncbi:MAG: DNA polymerase Y family protein [bacterium]
MSRYRIACAFVPDFALAVGLRGLPGDERDEPVVLVEPDERARVRALNRAAEAGGARLGQTASRARAVVPGLHCLPWDEKALVAASRRLAEALYGASPMVVPLDDTPGAFWVDARGMRWMGGEPGLCERLIAFAADAGHPALRVGVADGATAARAAAAVARPHHIVPPGEDARFLGTLPLDALAIDPELRDVLRSLGLSTVAELRKLPEPALISRFGVRGRDALERAGGLDPHRPSGRPPPALPEAVLALDAPVSETGALVFGLRGLADTLAARLIDGGLSATRLSLVLALDDRSEVSEALVPARPAHHPHLLFELVRDRLERGAAADLRSPVVEVRLQVQDAIAATAEQAHLGAAQWDPAALEGALNRLQGRYGEPVVFEPEARDDARPEKAGVWSPVVEVPLEAPLRGPGEAPAADPAPVRRWLSVPQAVEVRVDADGRPQAVRWGGGCRTADARGPERLSGSWWSGSPYAREDYRLALADGGILWVGRDARTDTWWVLGWLD